MGYGGNIYKAASDKLFERRLSAQRAADERKNRIYGEIPRVKELDMQISASGTAAARAVVAGGDVKKTVSRLRDENLALQAELKFLLTENGYDENVFEPDYFCKKCRDTGYTESNGKTVLCTCLKSLLVSCACDELNRRAPLSLSTFESFSLENYDRSVDLKTGVSPYAQMTKILKYCKNYANNFTPHAENILMKGATGLGKTHLSLAIANEAIKKGFGVIYVSAPTLVSKLEKRYFSNDDIDAELNLLFDCDLLIIDDLGTEFHTQFSTSQLYNIFNSRLLSGKPVIINTNHSLRELKDIYTDRFVSRIFGGARKLDFVGRDIRIAGIHSS